MSKVRIVKKSFFGLKTRTLKPRKNEVCTALQVSVANGKATISISDMKDIKLYNSLWECNKFDMLLITFPISIRGRNKSTVVSITAFFEIGGKK